MIPTMRRSQRSVRHLKVPFFSPLLNPFNSSVKFHVGQSIQEWTKLNLWKTTFKRAEVIWSAYTNHITSIFQRLSATNFTWSILQFFVPYINHPFFLLSKTKEMTGFYMKRKTAHKRIERIPMQFVFGILPSVYGSLELKSFFGKNR